MKNHKIFAKRTLCVFLSAALVSFGGYTAAFAENENDITPAAEQPEATASPSPSASPEAEPTASPTADPTETPAATAEPAKLTLRVNAKVYKTTNGVYKVLFSSGSTLPAITGFEFTARFDGAVVKTSEPGDSLKDNGDFSRSIRDDNEITLQEILENNDRNVEDEVDLKFKIKNLYNKMKQILKDREKLIIELRFGLNGEKPKTQKEIAKMLDISRSYVSRIESKAIGKLAKEIRE